MGERFIGIKMPKSSRNSSENARVKRQGKPKGITLPANHIAYRGAIFKFVNYGTKCFRIDVWPLHSLNSFLHKERNILRSGTQRRNIFQQVKRPTMMNTRRMQWWCGKDHLLRFGFWSCAASTIGILANCNSKKMNGGTGKFLETNLKNIGPTKGLQLFALSSNT